MWRRDDCIEDEVLEGDLYGSAWDFVFSKRGSPESAKSMDFDLIVVGGPGR